MRMTRGVRRAPVPAAMASLLIAVLACAAAGPVDPPEVRAPRPAAGVAAATRLHEALEAGLAERVITEVELELGASFLVRPIAVAGRADESRLLLAMQAQLTSHASAISRFGRRLAYDPPPEMNAFRHAQDGCVSGAACGGVLLVDPTALAMDLVGTPALYEIVGVAAIEIAREAALSSVDERVGIARLLADPSLDADARWARVVVLHGCLERIAERAARRLGYADAVGAREAVWDDRCARAERAALPAADSAAAREVREMLERRRMTAILWRESRSRVERACARLADRGPAEPLWWLIEHPPSSVDDLEDTERLLALPPIAGAGVRRVQVDEAWVAARVDDARQALAGLLADLSIENDVTSLAWRRVGQEEMRELVATAFLRSPAPPSPSMALTPLETFLTPGVLRAASSRPFALDRSRRAVAVDLGLLGEALADVPATDRDAVAALLAVHAMSARVRPPRFAGAGWRPPRDSDITSAVRALDEGHGHWLMRRVAARTGWGDALAAAVERTPLALERRRADSEGLPELAHEREVRELATTGVPDMLDRLHRTEGTKAVRQLLEGPPTAVAALGSLCTGEPLASEPATADLRFLRLASELDMPDTSGAFVSSGRVSRALVEQLGLRDGAPCAAAIESQVAAVDRAVATVDIARFRLPPAPASELLVARFHCRPEASPDDRVAVEAAALRAVRWWSRLARAWRAPASDPPDSSDPLVDDRFDWAVTQVLADGTRADPSVDIPMRLGVARRGEVIVGVLVVAPGPDIPSLATLLVAAFDDGPPTR